MKHLIIFTLLFISVTVSSQNPVTMVSDTTTKPTIITQSVNDIQIERIVDIEKRLSAYYTYNRRSQTLIYVGLGLSLAGIIISQGQNNTATQLIPLAGSIVSLAGTIIYLDSFKFLNFKPKHREIREMTYY